MALPMDDPNVPVLMLVGGLAITMDNVEQVIEKFPPEPYTVLVNDYIPKDMREDMADSLKELARLLESV